jgi:hypothetical protein
MSSDSDDEVGRQLDEPPPAKKPKPKVERPKVTNEVAQPIPSPPLPATRAPRLTKARREEIIREFEGGKEDGEYAVTKLGEGQYKVQKRKQFHNPSASVNTGNKNLEVTWSHMIRERDDDLVQALKKINKRCKKLEQKYVEYHTPRPVEAPAARPPPPPNPEVRMTRVPPKPPAKPRKRWDIRDF